MSFILDALKKSEAERNRQSGPALMDMRIAPPRRRLPVWALVLTGVLVANLAFLIYVLTRGSSTPAVSPAVAQSAAAGRTPAAPNQAAAAAALPTRVVPAPVLPPPMLPGVVSSGSAANPLPASTQAAKSLSPDDKPAVVSNDADLADLPTLEDLKASGVGLPEFHLSLHAYDAVPANRYVLMNSAKLREGDGTIDGATVERITSTGVVLVWHNRRFIVKASQ